MVVRRSHGYSLVELMVVVAMVGILAGATLPLGSLWVNGAKLAKVEGALTQAVGKAKSAAIRNSHNTVAGQPVAMVCLTNTELSVRQSSNSAGPSCGVTPTGFETWRAELLSEVSISSGDDAVSCICFNSYGMLNTAGACSGCLSDNPVNLEVGSKNESLYIF